MLSSMSDTANARPSMRATVSYRTMHSSGQRMRTYDACRSTITSRSGLSSRIASRTASATSPRRKTGPTRRAPSLVALVILSSYPRNVTSGGTPATSTKTSSFSTLTGNTRSSSPSGLTRVPGDQLRAVLMPDTHRLVRVLWDEPPDDEGRHRSAELVHRRLGLDHHQPGLVVALDGDRHREVCGHAGPS